MLNPYEFVTVQTVAKEEVRTDPETDETYTEQVIVAEDKKLKLLIDLNDIEDVSETINRDAIIYAKRTSISYRGVQAVVLMSYSDVKKLLVKTHKHAGFGNGDTEEKKESS